jgi:hypothetical protein
LFIVSFLGSYKLLNDETVQLDKAVGTWTVRNNKVFARINFFLTKQRAAPGSKKKDKKDMIRVTPYEIEIIDIKYIDAEVGYSRRPFARFDLPAELKDKFKISEWADKEEGLLGRFLYEIVITPPPPPVVKEYYRFRIFPDMAREGLSGLDIAQSPELIKKYIWDL